MSESVGYTPGSGSEVAVDKIGGVIFQRVKLVIGADSVDDGNVSATNNLPVSGTLLVAGYKPDGTLELVPVTVTKRGLRADQNIVDVEVLAALSQLNERLTEIRDLLMEI